MGKGGGRGPLLPGFEPEGRPAGQSEPARAVAPRAAASQPGAGQPQAAAAHPPQPGAAEPQAAAAQSSPASLAGQTVWVVDSHSLIHQVFHALPEMTSPRGEPVAAVFGFARDLFYLLEVEAAGLPVLRVRPAGQDLPARAVRAVQGGPAGDARGPGAADRRGAPHGRGPGAAGAGVPGLRGRRRGGHRGPADRGAGRTLLHRHRRQGLPATDHRAGEALQHPQGRGHRSRGVAAGVGHRAAAGRRLPGPGGRRDRQRAGRAAGRAQGGPRAAGKIRHAGECSTSTPRK